MKYKAPTRLLLALFLFATVGVQPIGGAGYRVLQLDRLTTVHIAHADPVHVNAVSGGWDITLSNGAKHLIDNDTTGIITRFLAKYTNPVEAAATARLLMKESDRPLLFAAMAAIESGCDSTKTSSKGAQGKWQVLPVWKRTAGFEFYRVENSHLRDELNLRAARKILGLCLVSAHGNQWRAVRKYCGVGKYARHYEKKVRKAYAELQGLKPRPRSLWLYG